MNPASERRLSRPSRLATVLAVAALALVGCADLLPGQGPPPRLFTLSPKSTFDASLPRVDWQLVVEMPIAAAGLDTTRVALYRNPLELEYYARASWTDRATQLVQTLIVESFENSRLIVAVGRESLGLRADYVLKTELREFQAMYDGPTPAAVVQIHARLVAMPERTIVASERFEARIPAGQDAIEPVVGAFDAALGKVLRDLVGWTLVAGEASRRSRR